MTNFDYLKKEKDFDSFVDIAIVAEKTYKIDVSTCIINCRRALEAGVKWMYSVDADLDVPYQDNLNTLMNTRAFKSIMDDDIWKRIEFIRRYGNEAVHTSTKKRLVLPKYVYVICSILLILLRIVMVIITKKENLTNHY